MIICRRQCRRIDARFSQLYFCSSDCQRQRAYLFKQLLLKNRAVDFVEIFKVCTRKAIINAAKRIFNSDKICRSYCDFYFGVTFLEHTVDRFQTAANVSGGCKCRPVSVKRIAADVVVSECTVYCHVYIIKFYVIIFDVLFPGVLTCKSPR